MSTLQLAGWRAQDLLDADLPEGFRYEVVDGHLVVTPAPALPHSIACQKLAAQLELACTYEWLVAPGPNLLLGTDLRIPDIAVLRREALREQQPLGEGPASFGLVVEVTSPSTRKTDLFAKPGEYAEAGIPLFWRVDLEPSLRLHAFVLRGASYDEVSVIERSGVAPAPWGDVTIDLTALADLLRG